MGTNHFFYSFRNGDTFIDCQVDFLGLAFAKAKQQQAYNAFTSIEMVELVPYDRRTVKSHSLTLI
jgi:hypothetical protein